MLILLHIKTHIFIKYQSNYNACVLCKDKVLFLFFGDNVFTKSPIVFYTYMYFHAS